MGALTTIILIILMILMFIAISKIVNTGKTNYSKLNQDAEEYILTKATIQKRNVQQDYIISGYDKNNEFQLEIVVDDYPIVKEDSHNQKYIILYRAKLFNEYIYFGKKK